jgi:Kelch motif
MPRFLAILGVVAIALSGCAGQATPASVRATAAVPVVTKATRTVTPSAPPATPSPVTTGPWSATARMITARAEHTATLLQDGRVLIAGGVADNREEVALASAEIYDPTTGSWSATGSMQTPRSQHTATLLPDGKVLVAGGYCPGRNIKGCPVLGAPEDAIDPDGAISLAELYDPHSGQWIATGSMTTQRSNHTATLLANGEVLVAGAEHGMPDAILDSAELYDPETGTWTATGSMITARTQQMATPTPLPDGRVLVAGGVGPVSPTAHGELTSAELYDPSTGNWTDTGPMGAARSNDPLIVLADGLVLKTGGAGPGDLMLASCELYDPSTGTWNPTGSLTTARGMLSSTLLADGNVLVAAGFGVPLASAELYDATTGTWSDAGNFGEPTFEHTATLLLNGKVLVTGGLLADGVASSAELYDPDAGT